MNQHPEDCCGAVDAAAFAVESSIAAAAAVRAGGAAGCGADGCAADAAA